MREFYLESSCNVLRIISYLNKLSFVKHLKQPRHSTFFTMTLHLVKSLCLSLKHWEVHARMLNVLRTYILMVQTVYVNYLSEQKYS